MTNLKIILEIIRHEMTNRADICLFLEPYTGMWKAYAQSAVNLKGLMPTLEYEKSELVFSDVSFCLPGVTVTIEQLDNRGLIQFCTLVSDNYIRLCVRN
ncbi:hypothetical protein [Coprobacter tertius]|uniref:Uncharacterized protein n=1 Tax=Coprobacter tertius TaxID=2944915 RepID=A0ABT1MFH3_9BACT|nr:hypothetical protein [Coprobacter tertius]MCP9611387.1 hypothetical protein [Coprobacter tertius]